MTLFQCIVVAWMLLMLCLSEKAFMEVNEKLSLIEEELEKRCRIEAGRPRDTDSWPQS